MATMSEKDARRVIEQSAAKLAIRRQASWDVDGPGSESPAMPQVRALIDYLRGNVGQYQQESSKPAEERGQHTSIDGARGGSGPIVAGERNQGPPASAHGPCGKPRAAHDATCRDEPGHTAVWSMRNMTGQPAPTPDTSNDKEEEARPEAAAIPPRTLASSSQGHEISPRAPGDAGTHWRGATELESAVSPMPHAKGQPVPTPERGRGKEAGQNVGLDRKGAKPGGWSMRSKPTPIADEGKEAGQSDPSTASELPSGRGGLRMAEVGAHSSKTGKSQRRGLSFGTDQVRDFRESREELQGKRQAAAPALKLADKIMAENKLAAELENAIAAQATGSQLEDKHQESDQAGVSDNIQAGSNKITKKKQYAEGAGNLCGRLFDAIDDDSSGFLEEAEGKIYLSCSGCDASELEYYWSDLLRTADKNGDGRISKQEFLEYTLGDEELDASGGFADKEYERSLEQKLVRDFSSVLNRTVPWFVAESASEIEYAAAPSPQVLPDFIEERGEEKPTEGHPIPEFADECVEEALVDVHQMSNLSPRQLPDFAEEFSEDHSAESQTIPEFADEGADDPPVDGHQMPKDKLELELTETAAVEFRTVDAPAELDLAVSAAAAMSLSEQPLPSIQPQMLSGGAGNLCGRLFNAFDDDLSGYLEEAEGKLYLCSIGCEASELDYYWSDLLRTADKNGDGLISRKEFLVYVLGEMGLDRNGDFLDKKLQARLESQLLKRSTATVHTRPVHTTAGQAGGENASGPQIPLPTQQAALTNQESTESASFGNRVPRAMQVAGYLFDCLDIDASGVIEELEIKIYLACSGLDELDIGKHCNDLLASSGAPGAIVGKQSFVTYLLRDRPLTPAGDFKDPEQEAQMLEYIRSFGSAARLSGQLFDCIDRDGTGVMDATKGKEHLRLLDCDEEDLDCWTMPTNRDGDISREAYIKHVTRAPNLTEDGRFADRERQDRLQRGIKNMRDSELFRTDSELTTTDSEFERSSEGKHVIGKKIEAWFAHLGADKNGTLTVQEVEAGFKRMGLPFGESERAAMMELDCRLDCNAFSALVMDRLRRRRGLDLPGLGSPPARSTALLRASPQLSRADHISPVSAADSGNAVAGRIRAWFDSLDADKNGTLTVQEVEAGFKRMGLPFGESERAAMMEASSSSADCRLDCNAFSALIMDRLRRRRGGLQSPPVRVAASAGYVRSTSVLLSPASPPVKTLSDEMSEVLAATSTATRNSTSTLQRIRQQRAQFATNSRASSRTASRSPKAASPPALAATDKNSAAKCFKDEMIVHVESVDVKQKSLKVTIAELRDRIRDGRSTPKHLVWWKGLPEWMPIEDATQKFAALSSVVGP